MTLQQFLLILRAHAKIAVCTLLVTVSVTLVYSLLQPKQYSTSAAVVVDVKSPDPLAGMGLVSMIPSSYMATEVDIINSDRVAQRVIKLLHMDESQAIREQWQKATEGRGEFKAWLASRLQSQLKVKPSVDSDVININYSGTDPVFIAAVANAFAQAYIDVNLELKVEPARQNAIWFEGQTKLARDRLEAAQQALSSFQQKTGIVSDRPDFETAKLDQLNAQLTVVQAQTSDSHSKEKSAGDSGTLAEVMQNQLINSLKSDVARLDAKLQESNINLGENHPQTKRIESELASLRARLESETQKISSSLSTSYRVGKQKESELRAAIDAEKIRVLDLYRQRDKISVLKRDVESAQQAFEGVSQRTSLTRLESHSTQANVVILNPAYEPIESTKPKVMLNVLVSIFIGTLLGVGLALVLEFSNHRVRSVADLAESIDLPILASISSITPPSTLLQRLRSFFTRRKRRAAEAASTISVGTGS